MKIDQYEDRLIALANEIAGTRFTTGAVCWCHCDWLNGKFGDTGSITRRLCH